MHIITFDIEEWFHILDNNSTKSEEHWENREVRIYKNVDKILKILIDNNISASFFILGWIAEKYPDLVKKIVDNGFEIGSHSHLHQLIYNQDKKSFYNDVEKSIKTLEDITGKKVKIFRAPGFSITLKNLWAFEVLYELGITTDSSIFPTYRAHGGMPSLECNQPFLLNYNGVQLKEFPINTIKILNKKIVFSGGGYFRIIPYFIINKFMNKSDYVMFYLHPRDIDFNQPKIQSLSLKRKFKSYVGLQNAERKFNILLQNHHFNDIKNTSNNINWNNVPVINL